MIAGAPAKHKSEIPDLERRARKASYVGGDLFKLGYIFMMCSLVLILVFAHLLLGLLGLFVFVGLWIYLFIKTGPYERKNN